MLAFCVCFKAEAVSDHYPIELHLYGKGETLDTVFFLLWLLVVVSLAVTTIIHGDCLPVDLTFFTLAKHCSLSLSLSLSLSPFRSFSLSPLSLSLSLFLSLSLSLSLLRWMSRMC